MRAIEPRREGPLEVAGFTLYVEEYGDEAAPPVLLLPAWQIVPSRIWKM